jgi:hypothetical protein
MKVFFVLALGRSGTKFLSSLLSADARGVVHHEPHPYDHKLLVLRHAGSFDTAVDQLLERRFAELLPEDGRQAFYGEVNSYLRYEVDWLRRRFDPLLVHLVRDGRAFVRSAWIRDIYTPWQSDGPVLPRDDDPYASRWGELSRFERICWCWHHTNAWLADRLERRVRFEDLLTSYELLRETILEPAGMEISADRWRQEIGRPKNTSRDFRLRRLARRWVVGDRHGPPPDPLPHWSEWSRDLDESFWRICGETMQRMGYGR